MQRILKELTDLIGIADAFEICRMWGGRSLYIPVAVRLTDPLALSLGLEGARKLAASYGGRSIELPSERCALLELRNAAMFRDRQAGASHEQLAILYGLRRQSVRAALARARSLGLVAEATVPVGANCSAGTPDRNDQQHESSDRAGAI